MQLKLLSQHPTGAMKAAGAAVNGQGHDFAHHTWAVMFAQAPSVAPAFDVQRLQAALSAAGLEQELQNLGAQRLLAISDAILRSFAVAPGSAEPANKN